MISSFNNQQIKDIKLYQKKAKARDEKGIFIIEGIRMFQETPKERIVKVFVSQSFFSKNKDVLKDYSYEVVEDKIFESMSDTRTPQGILCMVKRQESSLDVLLEQENPHFVILENLQDPGNLGTIIRTGEGAGVTGIIMSKNTVDIYNPKVIRSTMGSIYRVPFLYVESLPDTIEKIRKKGIKVYAAHLDGRASYDRLDYTKGTAFLIGNEGNGLTKETADLADEYMRIPMEGQLESLNASVATALLMYEVHRQRSNS